MNDPKKPGQAEGNGSSPTQPEAGSQDDLGRRSRALEEALAAKRQATQKGDGSGNATGGSPGFGQAIKLSSEFIAGVAVGVGLGWVIDNVAGTSPWGLIVFLLLGFAAGVLNVMRATGQIAEPEMRVKPPETGQRKDD